MVFGFGVRELFDLILSPLLVCSRLVLGHGCLFLMEGLASSGRSLANLVNDLSSLFLNE